MRILTIPQFGIGDTLLATPAIRTLKESLPLSYMHVLTMFKSTYQVLLGNPYIDELSYIPFLKLGPWKTLRVLLSLRGKYDVSINFYPSNRYQYNLFAYIVGAPKRLGHRYLKSDLRSLNFLKNVTLKESREFHAVEENLALVELLGAKWDRERSYPLIYMEKDEEKRVARDRLRSLGIEEEKLIGFHPGSSVFKLHRFKRWPAEKFARLADALVEEDNTRRVLIFGGGEDRDAIDEILRLTKNPDRVFHINTKTVREAASLIKMCKLFVSNDSGIMHLAAAQQVPIAALFGPSNPKWVGPWGVKARVVRLGLPCSPCFYYSPKPMVCPANLNYKCMRELPLELVLHETRELIKEVGL